MIVRYILYFIFGAGLIACSSVHNIFIASNTTVISDHLEQNNQADSLILPYRLSLEKEMRVVISKSKNNFTKSRPNSSLGNWSADAILNSVDKSVFGLKSYFCLLNYGGLRSVLNKGDVYLEDIYKLMPFDNEIVVVELPFSSLEKIKKYIISSGGEPISNAILKFNKINFTSPVTDNYSFYVITSDYLMNGGDNMSFFQDKINVIHTNILLRDAMILEAKRQKYLVFNKENRIVLY